MTVSVEEKAACLAALHAREEAFPIPNPWDIGSARLMEALGFEALATTSSGFAQSLGRGDGDVTLEEVLRHCEELAAATMIPIIADFENGFGDDPETVAKNIRRATETGLVGASIEDFSGDPSKPIYEFTLSVARVEAAVEAAASCSFPFSITARAEQLLRANYDMDETIRRLQAYEEAGADVLYAPALKRLDDVRQLATAVNKPINVLGTMLAHRSVAALGEAGAKRVSVGGSMARQIAGTIMQTSKALLENGDLSWAKDVVPGAEVERLLAR